MEDPRTAESRRVMAEFEERQAAGDDSVFDDLVAPDFVNHAAGPQGRDGWRATFDHLHRDLADVRTERHHLVVDRDLVALHMTLHARHVGSTMPLLAGVPVTGTQVAWEFQHLFRIESGLIAEHWACRDDVGLLRQLGAWPPRSPA